MGFAHVVRVLAPVAPGRRCALPWAISSRPVGAMEDHRVLNIAGRILELQEFAFARNFAVTYPARLLIALKKTLGNHDGSFDQPASYNVFVLGKLGPEKRGKLYLHLSNLRKPQTLRLI